MPRRPASAGGGAPPPVSPPLPAVDEGPMRRALLRQIRQLELEISRFIVDNLCYDQPLVTSPTRGPAILTTAQLEEIRDELLATRAQLHDLVVARAAEAAWPADRADGGGRSLRNRLRGRLGGRPGRAD